MRIGIGADWIGVRGGGVETYVRNLLPALAALNTGDEFILYSHAAIPVNALQGTENMRRSVVAPRVRAPFAFSRTLVNARLDVYHEQTLASLLFGAPLVITLHDVYFEHVPHEFAAVELIKRRLATFTTTHRAAAILTDSEFSKGDIVSRYGVSPHKITVVPLAAAPMYRLIHDQAVLASVKERHDIHEHFILYAGVLKPNKNLPRVIEAYARLRRTGVTRHRLVIAGGTASWLRDDLRAVARSSGYGDDIVFTGYVPDEDLVALYNAADLFVHPSLFEGFGLPPLEAMACGTAVITSNTTALPEVVGDAALTVDPLDVEALAEAMAIVLGNTTLRSELEQRGLERAAQFSWEHTARIVHGVYHTVGNKRHEALRCGL